MKLSPSKYPLICFDLDDTLISGNTWYRFNMALDVPPEKDLELYTAYHENRLSYTKWTQALQSLYRTNVTRSDIETLFSQYDLAPGSKEAVNHAQARGYTLAIITGSFSEAAKLVGKELGIEHTFGVTHCSYNESDVFTDIVSSGEVSHTKLSLLV